MRLFIAIVLTGAVTMATPLRADGPMTPVRPTPPEAASTSSGEGGGGGSGAPQWIEPPAAADATAGASRRSAMTPSVAASSPTPAGVTAPAAAAGAAAAAAATPAASAPPGTGRARLGQWEFTARLLGASSPSHAGAAQKGSPPAAAPGQTDAHAGISTIYSSCIMSDNAVPAELEPQCSLDSRETSGPAITWSMTCANTHVHSEGVAQYRGDTMEATVVSQLPRGAGGGAVTSLIQHIDGHYVGPCGGTAAAPAASVDVAPPPKDGRRVLAAPVGRLATTSSGASDAARPKTMSETTGPPASRHRPHPRHYSRTRYSRYPSESNSLGYWLQPSRESSQ